MEAIQTASDDESINEFIDDYNLDIRGQSEKELIRNVNDRLQNKGSRKFADRVSEVMEDRIRQRDPKELLQFFSERESRIRFVQIEIIIRRKKQIRYRDLRTGRFVKRSSIK